MALRRLAALVRAAPGAGGLRRHTRSPAPVEVFGLRFPNPVGLAAGLDKDGRPSGLAGAGLRLRRGRHRHLAPQPGNDRPRLFRLRSTEAVINRMGFNNAGAGRWPTGWRAARAGCRVPLGISLGKSKVTPLDEAVDDYLASLRAL